MTAEYDAAILLGGGVRVDGSLGECQRAQIEATVALYAGGVVPALITCGAFSYKYSQRPPLTEARAYGQYAQKLGVPTGAIIEEQLPDESLETIGNLYFAKRGMIDRGMTNGLIVPTCAHSDERAQYLARKIFGNEGGGFNYSIFRPHVNNSAENIRREQISLETTKVLNGHIPDGDHEGVFTVLLQTHPAYGGKNPHYTADELKALLRRA